MSLSDKKLQKFELSVFKEADEEIAKILKGISKQKKKVLAQTKDAELARHFGHMQEEISNIKQDCIRRVSLEEQQVKKQLLLKREEISGRVFFEVLEKLAEFTKSDDYKTLLETEIKSALNICGYEGSCMHASAVDTEFIRKICGEVEVKTDLKIEFGGFILKNSSKGIAIDNSFESRLNAQHNYFNKISKLTLEE